MSNWRPPSFSELQKTRPGSFHQELDRAIQTAYQNQDVLQSITVQGAAGTTGIRIAAGSTTVLGSKLSIDTGLDTVTDVTASLDVGSAAINEWVSASIGSDPGTISIYVWKPTASNNVTPIASTTARTIRWTVHGRT